MRALLVLALLSLTIAACDSGVDVARCELSTPTQTALVACVTGAVDTRVSGSPAPTGWGDHTVPVDLWALTTSGSAVSGGVDLYVYLQNGAGEIELGTYGVEPRPTPVGIFDGLPVDDEARPGLGVAVIYLPRQGGGVDVWRATAGTITVEQNDADGLAGRFALESVREGAQIQVEGRFLYAR